MDPLNVFAPEIVNMIVGHACSNEIEEPFASRMEIAKTIASMTCVCKAWKEKASPMWPRVDPTYSKFSGPENGFELLDDETREKLIDELDIRTRSVLEDDIRAAVLKRKRQDELSPVAKKSRVSLIVAFRDFTSPPYKPFNQSQLRQRRQ
jgi:hypothetical protein